jgi:hypothetical protein
MSETGSVFSSDQRMDTLTPLGALQKANLNEEQIRFGNVVLSSSFEFGKMTKSRTSVIHSVVQL